MPHRILSFDEVAQYLHLHRRDVERLVKEREIPFEMQRDRIVFRKRQIETWASQRILGMSDAPLKDYHKAVSAKRHDLSAQHAIMPELVGAARIDPAMTSRTKASVLRDMVKLGERTELVADAAELLSSLDEREKLCSTALPDGIALLHPRHHDPYMFLDSFIVLGRLVQPVYFGAADGEPTELFFLICSQEDRIHLHILARLCAMIRGTSLVNSLQAAETAVEMAEAILASETEVMRHL